jgi:hypothetical protein
MPDLFFASLIVWESTDGYGIKEWAKTIAIGLANCQS